MSKNENRENIICMMSVARKSLEAVYIQLCLYTDTEVEKNLSLIAMSTIVARLYDEYCYPDFAKLLNNNPV